MGEFFDLTEYGDPDKTIAFKEKIFFAILLLILLFYISALRFSRNSKTNPFKNFNNANNANHSNLVTYPTLKFQKKNWFLLNLILKYISI